MKRSRRRLLRVSSAVILALIVMMCLASGYIAPTSYEHQFRNFLNAPPSPQFRLGTDALGRDRFTRLLYGARVSLLLAPAAAVLAVALAAVVGGLTALAGGWPSRLVSGTIDLFLSLPWLFLLLAMRAALPLNTTPEVSVTITFVLLGLLGWAGPARVVRAAAASWLRSDFVLAARSRGLGRMQILLGHVLPNLRPVLAAQFWTTVPIFILAEANLSILGLGVAEPLPSLGNLLRELESQTVALSEPWSSPWLFSPVALLVAVMACVRGIFPAEVPQ